MKWYEGGIPKAIQEAKKNKSVFIVFIAGDNEASSTMESYLHRDDVTELCEGNNAVAVRLDANGNDCKFFSQIYPVVLVPSTFFIGDSGVPLEVIGEVASHEEFLGKVKNAIELQNNSAASRPGAQQTSQTSAPTQQQQQVDQEAAGPSTRDADLEEMGAVGVGSGDDVSTKEPKEDLKERVERAKVLVEQKKEEKSKKEEEDHRRREIERRAVGQGVQKLRQQQKEQEMLEAKREQKRDKEEDRLARQRVKDEIARDRAEKAARHAQMKDDRAKAAEENRRKKLEEQQAAAQADQAKRSEIARIQFRKPDGSFVTHQFPATDTFATVNNFITEHMGLAVRLSTTFPRRTFTEADHNSTLQDLQLAPSAAVLVLPAGMSTSGVRSSSGALSLGSIASVLFAPFVFMWGILSSLLGLAPSSSSPTSPSSPAQRSSRDPSTSTGGDRNRGGAVKRPASNSRQEGSIHRFRNSGDDDDDEDRNTWNGNSTQQM